jgi:hypothetical protein
MWLLQQRQDGSELDAPLEEMLPSDEATIEPPASVCAASSGISPPVVPVLEQLELQLRLGQEQLMRARANLIDHLRFIHEGVDDLRTNEQQASRAQEGTDGRP